MANSSHSYVYGRSSHLGGELLICSPAVGHKQAVYTHALRCVGCNRQYLALEMLVKA